MLNVDAKVVFVVVLCKFFVVFLLLFFLCLHFAFVCLWDCGGFSGFFRGCVVVMVVCFLGLWVVAWRGMFLWQGDVGGCAFAAEGVDGGDGDGLVAGGVDGDATMSYPWVEDVLWVVGVEVGGF